MKSFHENMLFTCIPFYSIPQCEVEKNIYLLPFPLISISTTWFSFSSRSPYIDIINDIL